MSEAVKVIISAWSVAFIFLFLFWTVFAIPDRPDHAQTWAAMWFFLLCGAVTGSGWLWHRHNEKEDAE